MEEMGTVPIGVKHLEGGDCLENILLLKSQHTVKDYFDIRSLEAGRTT